MNCFRKKEKKKQKRKKSVDRKFCWWQSKNDLKPRAVSKERRWRELEDDEEETREQNGKG